MISLRLTAENREAHAVIGEKAQEHRQWPRSRARGETPVSHLSATALARSDRQRLFSSAAS